MLDIFKRETWKGWVTYLFETDLKYRCIDISSTALEYIVIWFTVVDAKVDCRLFATISISARMLENMHHFSNIQFFYIYDIYVQ